MTYRRVVRRVEEEREERGVLTVLWPWVRDPNWLLGKRLRAAPRHPGILLESQTGILVHRRPADHRYPPGMEKHPQDVNGTCGVQRDDMRTQLTSAISWERS